MPASCRPAVTEPVPVIVSVSHGGGKKMYRLPGPLALIQTDAVGGGADHVVTSINGLSLQHIQATYPEVAHGSNVDGGTSGALLTSVSRGGVTVRALSVVAVHSALLAGGAPSPSAPAAAASQPGGNAATEQRALMRAAARLTWGLAGLVFELMHSQAGHWPALRDAVRRQAMAGAVLTQLYGLNRNLALAVLRAYGQLNPARFEEMLQSGLLPAPAKPRSAAAPHSPATAPEEACAPPSNPNSGQQHQPEEAAAQV